MSTESKKHSTINMSEIHLSETGNRKGRNLLTEKLTLNAADQHPITPQDSYDND